MFATADFSVVSIAVNRGDFLFSSAADLKNVSALKQVKMFELNQINSSCASVRKVTGRLRDPEKYTVYRYCLILRQLETPFFFIVYTF